VKKKKNLIKNEGTHFSRQVDMVKEREREEDRENTLILIDLNLII